MDKYSVYTDIEQRIRNCNTWTKTREGGLIVGIICQRIKDAMGILRADKVRVYIPVEQESIKLSEKDAAFFVESVLGDVAKNSKYVKRRTATHQQIAIQWFRDKEHFPWCDLVDITPTWINHLLKTKAGVQL